jgi:CRISPR-associated endoribonuclease Cas6
LKKDLHYKETFQAISKYINFTIKQHCKSKIEEQSFKPYCFGGFYPIEKDKLYKEGNVHKFTIRVIDSNLLDLLIEKLPENLTNNDFLVTQIQQKSKNQFFIKEIYSATPVIVSSKKNEKGFPIYWTQQKDGDIDSLLSHLNKNLLTKYEMFYNEELPEEHNFVKYIELKNKVPQNIHINKNGRSHTFFGNKFKIIPNKDETSQKLAFLALSTGLGEKTYLGGGFCLWK